MGGPTYVMGDHADHIHVGFRPLFGENRRNGQGGAGRCSRAEQWTDLVDRLGKIENPVVPHKTSKYSLPVGKRRSSEAHRGD